MGVLAPAPTPNSPELENFGRHDVTDRPMFELSKFMFALALPTEEFGVVPAPEINREKLKLTTLFEKAMLGFFTIDPVVKKEGWRAKGSEQHNWPSEDSSARIKELFPIMRKDIVLINNQLDRRIVIDTKFTNILSKNRYEDLKFKSGHLYQIYSYVRSQEKEYPDTEGVLLYPETEGKIDEYITHQGHRFRFFTVDLTADSQDFLKELRQLVA